MKIPKFNFQLKSLKEGVEKVRLIIFTMTVKGKRIIEYLGISIAPKNWYKTDEHAFVEKNLTERKQRELKKVNRIINVVIEEITILIQSHKVMELLM